MHQPRYCLRDAWELFSQQMDQLEEPQGLLGAAIAISMHALDDVNGRAVVDRLDELAELTRQRISRLKPAVSDRAYCEAQVHSLREVLFQEQGFTGNSKRFYYPISSCLPVVLQVGTGTPATLGLVYKLVAERLNISVMGVNAPFRFYLRTSVRGRLTLIDPFDGGALVAKSEAVARIERQCGRHKLRRDEYLPPATHRDWIRRILDNLIFSYWLLQAYDDMLAMAELKLLLGTSIKRSIKRRAPRYHSVTMEMVS